MILVNWEERVPRKLNPHILSGVCVVLLCVLFLSGVVSKNIPLEKQETPLLLNSGLTTVQQAEVKIILWFEQKPFENIKQSLPQEGWEWKESEFKAPNGKVPYTLSGYKLICSEEEEQIFSWFRELTKKVQDYGGTVYLDERVPEGIDVIKYSVQQEVIPVQWALSENTLSITGFKNGLYPSIQAGDDLLNIQLLSLSNGDHGKTALVIPVLLEEF